MKLSKRLKTIVDFVPTSSLFVADVGADHGLVCLELLKRFDDIKIFASDNKKGPFDRLSKNLSSFNNVNLSLSSGLDELPLEVDTLIIAGMGGGLVKEILENGISHFSHLKYIILSPHKEEDLVRKLLYENGFIIDKETFLCDDKKFYSIMRFIKGNDVLSDLDLKYGPINRRVKNKDFIDYINKEIERNERLLNNKRLSIERNEKINSLIKELKSL